jgi:hypothetical protein
MSHLLPIRSDDPGADVSTRLWPLNMQANPHLSGTRRNQPGRDCDAQASEAGGAGRIDPHVSINA